MTERISILATSLFAAAFAWSAHGQNSDAVPAGIDQLHKDDIAATVARDVDALAALMGNEAVLLQPGTPSNRRLGGLPRFHECMARCLDCGN
jgi:hypothetical protein